MTVGHSLGSVLVISEAVSHRDVDSVVVSSLGEGLTELTDNLHPAHLEPRRFPDLPAGYLTTTPNVRGRVFYHAPNVDDEIVAMDEATKQTMTEAEAASFPAELARSPEIEVPVLAIVGDHDSFFCTDKPCSTPGTGGAVVEEQHWAAGGVTVKVVPDAGHNLALHRNAAEFFARVAAWTEHSFGSPHSS